MFRSVYADKTTLGSYRTIVREITSNSRIPGILSWKISGHLLTKTIMNLKRTVTLWSAGFFLSVRADHPLLLRPTHLAQGLHLSPPRSPSPGSRVLTEGDLGQISSLSGTLVSTSVKQKWVN